MERVVVFSVSELMTKKKVIRIFFDKSRFFQKKFDFFEKKFDFFQEKFDFSAKSLQIWPWVFWGFFSGPRVFDFFRVATLIRGLVVLWTKRLRHLHLSSVSFSSFSNDILAHFSVSSIHRIFGLPCFLTPGTVSCMISFSRHSVSFLITRPKYDRR